MYRLFDVKTGKYVKSECYDDTDEYELYITQYPYIKRRSSGVIGNKKKNPSHKTLVLATEQCVKILSEQFGITEQDLENINIFCPLHENKTSSNSPSARFRVSRNIFMCYSSQCPLKKVPTNSVRLLEKLLKRN